MREIIRDIEREDAFVAEEQPVAEEQVAIRIHEWRAGIAELADLEEIPRWDELDTEAQLLSIAIGAELAERLVRGMPPALLAHLLHDIRLYLDEYLPRWDQLDADEQNIAIALMGEIVAWLQSEGQIS